MNLVVHIVQYVTFDEPVVTLILEQGSPHVTSSEVKIKSFGGNEDLINSH